MKAFVMAKTETMAFGFSVNAKTAKELDSKVDQIAEYYAQSMGHEFKGWTTRYYMDEFKSDYFPKVTLKGTWHRPKGAPCICNLSKYESFDCGSNIDAMFQEFSIGRVF